MDNKFILFEGYDGDKLVYENKIPIGCITEKQIVLALKCLTSKASLTYDEIIGGCSKKKTKISNLLLDVQRGSPDSYLMVCGENPYFIARTVSEKREA